MRIDEIHNPQVWDQFIQAHALDGGFLQSWAWGDFQKSMGRSVVRLGIYAKEGEDVQAVVVMVRHALPLGFSYWYSPRGPVMGGSNVIAMRALDAITHYVHEQALPRTLFWRLDAPLLNTAGSCISLQRLGFLKSPQELQPKATLILDLSKSEEQLLAEMHQKTRYNIRLAEKRGVEAKEVSDVDAFWSLLQETAQRDGFRTHAKEYYEKLLGVHTQLFIAEHEGKVLAAALVAFHNNWALYLHGASSSEQRDVMAPHLLHWRIMQEAKRRGCTKYDFWGVDQHKWPGVTRFKQGFSPSTPFTSYCGAWDYPLHSNSYKLYRMLLRVKQYVRR